MRKYTLAIIFLSAGILLLLYTFLSGNKSEYTENIFSKEASSFDKTFSVFITGIQNNIKDLKNTFQNPEKIRDTSFTLNFITEEYNKYPYLRSVAFLQNNYKIASKKDKNSVIMAIDSTLELDIVKWKRYEKGKLISTWDESFDEEINNTDWFKKLSENNNKILWHFQNKDTLHRDKDLFYLGYSYKNKGLSNIILFGISRKSMMNSFSHFSDIDSLKLIIGNQNNKVWELNSGNQVARLHSQEKDSVTQNVLNHFKRFEKEEKGIFNFKYHNTTFWNNFKILPEDTGFKFYILSIPEFQILQNAGEKQYDYLLWLALFLVFTGLILLLKKKNIRFPKKVDLLPAQELLKEDENRYLEFKSSCRWDYRQEKTNPELENVILKTIAAFCNTEGGTLLIGVDDDKNILGLERDFSTLKKSTPDYYEIHLRNLFHNMMGVKNVSKHIRIAFENMADDKVICKIRILASDEPVFIKMKNKNGQPEEKFYVRSGNSSQEIKSIVDINDYINSRFKK